MWAQFRCGGNQHAKLTVRWSADQDAGSCRTQEMRINDYHFLVLDYGDSIRLSDQTKRYLGYGEGYGGNQCAIVSIAAAADWLSQGKPRRRADEKRVGNLAHVLREAEMLKAREAYRVLQKPTTQTGVEIRSISRSAVSPIHHRDLRTLHLCMLECVLGELDSECAVLEVGGNDERTADLYSREGKAECQPFFIIAYNGHMLFARQTEYTAPKKWKLRKEVMVPSYLGTVVPCGDGGMLESSDENCDHIPPAACKDCKAKVGTCLSQAVVGNVDDSEDSQPPNPFTLEAAPNRNRRRTGLLTPPLKETQNDTSIPSNAHLLQTSDGALGTPSGWNETPDQRPPDLSKIGENASGGTLFMWRWAVPNS